MESEEPELPPDVLERIKQGLRDGVSYSISNLHRDGDWRCPKRDLRIREIHWRPGDPNALAAAIIKQVNEEEMKLDLDGHAFLIRKV